jgi:hypothetical protein
MRIGVPLLVAFMPQDAFYGIDNDVCRQFVSASHSSVSFDGLANRPCIRLGIAMGLSIAPPI